MRAETSPVTAIAPIGASPLFPISKLAIIGTGLMGGDRFVIVA